MDTQRTGYLLQQYQSGQISQPEWEELAALLTDDTNNEHIERALQQAMEQHTTAATFLERDYRALIEKIIAVDRPVPSAAPVRRMVVIRRWGRVAAAVLLLLAAGIAYRSMFMTDKSSVPQQAAIIKDIAPGTQGAILTLGDGRQVLLDSQRNGLIAKQGATNVTLKDGAIGYDKNSTGAATTIYNTMTTPRGRQYQLLLPDGSRVWLNAASSIRYPVAFSGHERKVQITGEVYFEVAKNPAMPFKVNINNTSTVEVLGTHFNVNAYEDEAAMKTTLLEGKVKVSSMLNGEWSIIKPGEQAIASSNSPFTIDHSPDIDQVMAWKNGLFSFDNATIQTVMRQLSRWYNIDIIYEGNIPEQHFFGQMTRDLSLLQVLRGLQVTKVNVRLEGRKLIIKP
jgi:ferric-dicitrate binding protein FerR (iron transport regulator)